MFPTDGLQPVMRALCGWNPMSYAMAAMRRALYGGTLPEGVGLPGSSAGWEPMRPRRELVPGGPAS